MISYALFVSFRHNILFVEKDFGQADGIETFQPDIVLNETSCVILDTFDLISSNGETYGMLLLPW